MSDHYIDDPYGKDIAEDAFADKTLLIEQLRTELEKLIHENMGFRNGAAIAAAEARGAALAVAQVRRMAEEAESDYRGRMGTEYGSDRWMVQGARADALKAFAASLPVSLDLAAEVRRIEERLLADAEGREENARQFGQKEARERAVKLAEEYLEQLRQAGREGWSIALREYVRRLRESAP